MLEQMNMHKFIKIFKIYGICDNILMKKLRGENYGKYGELH